MTDIMCVIDKIIF